MDAWRQKNKTKQKNKAMTAKVNCPTQTKTSIEVSLCSTSAYPSSLQRCIEIIYAIAKDMRPVNTLCNGGFTKMINLLDKRYAIPSNGSTWALCKTLWENFKGISQMLSPISFIHIHPAGSMNVIKNFIFCLN